MSFQSSDEGKKTFQDIGHNWNMIIWMWKKYFHRYSYCDVGLLPMATTKQLLNFSCWFFFSLKLTEPPDWNPHSSGGSLSCYEQSGITHFLTSVVSQSGMSVSQNIAILWETGKRSNNFEGLLCVAALQILSHLIYSSQPNIVYQLYFS